MLVVKGGGIKTGGGDTAKKAKTVKEKERNSKKSSTTASSSDPPSGHIDAYLHHMYRQHKTSIQPHLVNHWLGDEAANSPAFRGLTASKNETVKADSDVTISVTPPLYKPRPKSGAAGGGGGGVQTQGVRIVGTAAD